MKKDTPLISVIVPCYKVERYLPGCIDSILRQTYEHLEIMLVDDGSPDRCGEICEDYAKQDPRIVVIHKENGGLSDARNVAIDQAKGEWITFVDSDDLVNDDYVEILYRLVSEFECECGVCRFKTFREGDEPVWFYGSSHHEKMDSLKAVEQMFYQEKFDNNAPAKLYHRRLFEGCIRFPKGRVFEDLATTYQLLLQSNGVAYTDATPYHYFLRENSIDGSYSSKKVEDGLAVLKSIDDNISKLRGIEKAYQCRKFSFLLHLLLMMPKGAEHYKEMVSDVKQIRLPVLLDSHARKKARVAALLSYFGIVFLKFVFSFVNQRRL